MKRRIAAVLLALCMCIGLLPATALAAEGEATDYISLSDDSFGSSNAGEKPGTVTVVVIDATNNQELGKTTFTRNCTANSLTISLVDGIKDEYDIESVDTNGSYSDNLSADSYSIESWSSPHGEGGLFTVYLCPEFEAPKVEGKVESGDLYYRITEASLLKLLHDNGVKVDEETTFPDQRGVKLHFVEEYLSSSEWSLDRAMSAANNLLYYQNGTVLSNLEEEARPGNIQYIEIPYRLGDGTEGSQKIYSGDLRYIQVSDNTYEIESDKNLNEHIVIFYHEENINNGIWVPYDVRFIEDEKPVEKPPVPPEYDYATYEFVAWTQQHDGGLPVISSTLVHDDMNVFPQYKERNSNPTLIHVMNNDELLKERVAELFGVNVDEIDWDSVKITVHGVNGEATNPDYGADPGIHNGWDGDYEYYEVYNYLTGVGDYENESIYVNDIVRISISADKTDGTHFENDAVIEKGPDAGDFSISTGSYSGSWLVELYINSENDYPVNPDPEPDPDPAITGFTKTLVETADEKAAATTAGIDLNPYTFPNEDNKVIIPYGGEVTLLYKITVTGDADTDFTVTDKGAELVVGADITDNGDGTFSGTIPAGQGEEGTITFYVAKTFKAEDITDDGKLTNTASIDSEDGVDEDEDKDTEEVDAEEESYKVYTYVEFVGSGTNGALTDSDKAYIEATYKIETDNLDDEKYLPLGTFTAPLPDPNDEAYKPASDTENGQNVFNTAIWEKVKPYLNNETFDWVEDDYKDNFILSELGWYQLCVANGATTIDPQATGSCWHLDGKINVNVPNISVEKTLTEIKRGDTTISSAEITPGMALEEGDKLTWTITVTNTGNAAATGLKLTDKLVAVDKDGTEYTRTGVTLAGPEGVNATGFTVPAAENGVDGEVTFTATYTVQKADKGLTLTNTATVSDGNEEGEDDTENPVADRKVEIEKKLTSATRDKKTVYDSATGTLADYKAQVGDVLTYTITVTNTGNVPLKDVTVTDSLWTTKDHYTITVDDDPAYTSSGSITIAKDDPIAVNGSVTITYTYTVQDSDVEAGEIVNTAGVYLPGDDDSGDEPKPDGEDDVTVEMDDYTISIEPADIVIYTGGDGYAGVLKNEDGDLLNEPTSGLPEPGYHLTLPDAVETWLKENNVDTSVAANLANYLHFRYYDANGTMARNWDLEDQGIYSMEDGIVTAYVYSLSANTVVGPHEDTPVRLEFTHNGEIVTDDIIEMDENTASATYQMTIYDGGLDQSQIKAVFTVEDSEGNEKFITCNVKIGTGDLIIKSVVDDDPVTDIVKDGDSVDSDTLTAVAGEDVKFYVNNSEVEVASDRVGLLVDSVSNSEEFDANLKNHAIDEARQENTSPASDARAQSFYLDLVDTDNGHAVVRPSDDVTIYWPMPTDADPNGDFYIVHYDKMDRLNVTDLQNDPDVEEVAATADDNHLTFTTDSFSPFVLVYEAKDTGGTDPGTEPDPDPNPGGGQDDSDPYLKFESNGGTKFDPIEADDSFHINVYDDDHYGSHIPTRPGYRFTGWYEDRNLTMRVDEDEELHVTGSKTVFAGWEETTVPSMLNGDDHYAYIQGYADGSVRPNANITRAQVATIFFRLLDEDVRDDYLTTYNTFPDVNEDYWANTAISTMASLGVINGRNSGLFDPDAYITRAEFAAICARFDDSGVDGITTFTDTVGHWAEDEISRAAALGWIQGYADGTFRPNQYITRAQAVTMINRVLCRLPETEDDLLTGMNTWTDCHVTDWFYLAIQEATNSHDFVAKDRVYESWTDLNRDPDWSRYE